MKEDDKLHEAEYFYKKMIESIDYPPVFGYNLSAFLCASRSVLQYLLEDVKNQKGGQSWYDNLIKNSKYAKYFRSKRDVNTHYYTIQTQKGLEVEKGEIKIIYYFDDWVDNKNIIQLGRNYLDELATFLQDGNKKRFLNYS